MKVVGFSKIQGRVMFFNGSRHRGAGFDMPGKNLNVKNARFVSAVDISYGERVRNLCLLNIKSIKTFLG
jgi:hypothetical protein